MATIDDVAKAAGVSKGTVSNVFSKKRPISKEVTERVLEVASQLNYKPNYWARTLATKHTRIIGLNMPGENSKFSHFHLALLNGVLKVCYENGYRLLVNTLSPEYQSQIQNVSSDPVDGMILLDPAVEDSRITGRNDRDMPLVIIGRPPERYESSLSFVNNDNVRIAQEVTQYLLDLGHQRILFLNAPVHTTVAQDRKQGYIQALRQNDLLMDPSLILHKEEGITSIEYGYQSATDRLMQDSSITAILVDTDKMALGVYRAVEKLGIKIPEDLSVFAFSDDSVFAPEFSPPLSSVRLNAEMLGIEAARLLLEQIQKGTEPVRQVIVPSELVKRESCAKAPSR